MKSIKSVHLNIALVLSICGVLFQNCAPAGPPDLSQLSSSSYVAPNPGSSATYTCPFAGQVLSDGQSVTAYEFSSVPAGSSCGSQVRTCSNGFLSGSFTHATCSVQSAAATASCSLNGQTILHGNSITTYQSTSAAPGTGCVSESRICANGTLSGNYTATTCSVECSFGGSNVLSGASVTAYQYSSVPAGSVCVSQARTCTNGSLSGTFQFAGCTVQAPTGGTASCTFGGVTIANGDSRAFYKTDFAEIGFTCASFRQLRTCNNGILSGSNEYQFSTCEQERVDRCGTLAGNNKLFSERLATCIY